MAQVKPERLPEVIWRKVADVAAGLLLGIRKGLTDIVSELPDFVFVSLHARPETVDLVEEATHQLIGRATDLSVLGGLHATAVGPSSYPSIADRAAARSFRVGSPRQRVMRPKRDITMISTIPDVHLDVGSVRVSAVGLWHAHPDAERWSGESRYRFANG